MTSDIIRQNLLRIRNERGYTQEEVASRTGISRSTICKLEKGKTSPFGKALPALCRLYKVSVDEFLETPSLHEDRNVETELRQLKEYYESTIEQYVSRISDLKSINSAQAETIRTQRKYIEALERKQ